MNGVCHYCHRIMDGIEGCFPKGVMFGLGIVPFVDGTPGNLGEPAAIIRKARSNISDDASLRLFGYIMDVIDNWQGDCEHIVDGFSAIMYPILGEDGEECGLLVAACEADYFDTMEQNLYDDIRANTPNIGCACGVF